MKIDEAKERNFSALSESAVNLRLQTTDFDRFRADMCLNDITDEQKRLRRTNRAELILSNIFKLAAANAILSS
ncbi:MAG: hypothetical protein QOD99_106 [Chthoniobacter sp.]|nr:hypothetical protein [Chthoniobacter sp.]